MGDLEYVKRYIEDTMSPSDFIDALGDKIEINDLMDRLEDILELNYREIFHHQVNEYQAIIETDLGER